MSFFKRLMVFIAILAALILFVGLFPVVAHSAPENPGSATPGHFFNSGFISLQVIPSNNCIHF